MRALCVALLVMLSATPAWAAGSDAALQSALTTDLNNYLTARAKIEHISTASLSIDLGGTGPNINVAVGTMQYGGGKPVTPDNLFQIGSNTKAFTASIILQLEAAGKLSIDDPLGKFLPQYPAWKDVTIRHLLQMTSGIPSYDNTAAMMSAYAAHPTAKYSLAQLVNYVYPTTPGAPKPTTGYSYSNTNYLLAEMIIEKVTGNSYESEVKRRILTAIPVENMYYSPNLYPPAVAIRTVSGYFWNHTPENKPLAPLLGKDQRLLSASWAQGAGGAVGSPEAMTVWARALYRSTAFLPAAQRAEMMSIVSLKTGKPIAVTSLADPRGFGLGIAQLTTKETGTVWFYEGETLGYRMTHVYFPKKNVILDFGLNSQPDPNQDNVGKLVVTIYETLHAAGKM
ncbi:MAG TPA: serine hydrolase domain-containing protein [Candidatus Acidoferrales bacterium]|nr:serine hydrolase domain-containing protein [Candidatus Acidoferrales bacterium]